jgi:glycerate 2-kinase
LGRMGRSLVEPGCPTPKPPARGQCFLWGGETTVRVVGDGTGGRNQELSLAAAIEIDSADGVVVASIGTDGIDGPTCAAGAVVDGTTSHRAKAKGIDIEAALERNDAHTVLDQLGDTIVTGVTGTNVMDLQVVLAV